uniref:ATP synthase complex subunit 8 n=1 Tax=Hygrotus nigrolineatus TaxID=878038 RepID=A0A343C1J3_9DYTI|nr:ATP synthase F0 subunit 8 [Hygrotus nigrolineatus]
MPQMMPLNWIFLYIFFSMMFILFNFMNYYCYLIKNKINQHNSIKLIKIKYNWKW